jgi:hypothetical protein
VRGESARPLKVKGSVPRGSGEGHER